MFVIGLALLVLLFSSVPSIAFDVGETFKDCEGCPEMIVVGPGEFTMGDDDGLKAEAPSRKVTVPKPFALGKYEVTFDEWGVCAAAFVCKPSPSDHGWGRGRYPIINVTYEDIQNYLDWISEKTGQTYRLPSEAEWEYAARAGTDTEYWWGDEPGENMANCRRCGTEWSGKGSAPTGSLPANPWGFHEMNGNAWEWVADCWHPNHQGAPANSSVRRDGNCQEPVIRGGSWYYFPKVSRAAYRHKNNVNIFSYNISFRVLREIQSPID